MHENFALFCIHIIYIFCGASSNSPESVKNRTGLVKKKYWPVNFFLISDTDSTAIKVKHVHVFHTYH